MILEAVSSFLAKANKGQADMSDEIIEEAVENFRRALKSNFKPKEEREWAPYLSTIGKPLCQQQMAKAGVEREAPDWHFRMKMLIGDMIEVAGIAIMKGAGIPIEDEQEEAVYETESGKIRGRPDFSVKGEGIYDFKSASKYQFTYKFNRGDGFEKLREDDAFGYIPQGYLYGASTGKKFCGWVVVNKETGEWCVLRPPIADNAYKKEALQTTEKNAKALAENAPFKRCYEPLIETFNGKKTGNKYLDTICSYCPYKGPCWGELTYIAQPKSKAKNPKHYYYVGEVNV